MSHHHHKGDFMKLNSIASHMCTNRHKNIVFVVDRRSRKLTCFCVVVGACGYRNILEYGYGLETAALSIALFDNGAAFGTCYELRCSDSTWCRKGIGSIQITATNFFPLTAPKQNEFGAT
jgi:hypothetical protein